VNPPKSLPTPKGDEEEDRIPKSTKTNTIPDQSVNVDHHPLSVHTSKVVQPIGTTLSHSPDEKPYPNAGESVDPLLVHDSQQPEALIPQGL